ncbi:hypothetical protein V4C85_13600 [Ralstonia solanacearum]|uniref:hypothetical protein n=1 Tax=Ralstonia solanacearum TaxID=305 RepID=UPI000AE8D3BC|nr:hypothetical protein [Ralstonia solanacearum]QNT25328.1 hypothetical protein C2I38_04590 [Ralstonia solanacearum]QNT62974.1 hypothetical protein C2L97_04595 [Ralstonia solanacearum]
MDSQYHAPLGTDVNGPSGKAAATPIVDCGFGVAPVKSAVEAAPPATQCAVQRPACASGTRLPENMHAANWPPRCARSASTFDIASMPVGKTAIEAMSCVAMHVPRWNNAAGKAR